MKTLTEPRPETRLPIKERFLVESPDRATLLGYLLLLVSTALYALEEYYDVSRGDDNFTIFFLHYFISVAYVFILIFNGAYGVRRSWRKENLHKTVILLNIFLVSAFALNRELPVFEDSVPWFCVVLVLMSAVMLSYKYFTALPKAANCIQHILLGSGLILYLYMTIYVANLYLLGTIGIILFGIGAHIFVPGLLLFAAIRLLIVTREAKQAGTGWVLSGALITIGFVVGFIAEWNARVKTIDRMANQSVFHADSDLPAWVKVAQSLKNDWITERILKSRLVYTVSNNHFQWDLFPAGSNWDEKRKHDPLVFLASGNSSSSLSAEDRKNILKALTDSRHRAQERLWSGDNLRTSYIVSDVDIYPELRLAYSEQYFNIRNSAARRNRWWGNSEEAIYTFRLPEGSVVTSLSLWVNGEERKAILTSKQKATEAYTTIVGREMRDPSVVHWQEGNTVSVRVFPCTPDEERKFKVGITSPLPVVGDQIVYRNLTFMGPDAGAATQTSRVRIVGKAHNVELSDSFEKNVKGEYLREGEYDPDLEITMDLLPINRNQFSFDGFTYSISTSDPSMSRADFSDIYLDLNNSWTADEIESLYALLDNYDVYVYLDNAFMALSPENWVDITNGMREMNFSLFPFYRIEDTKGSLVVTKGPELSPYLHDFRGSGFAEAIGKYFASGDKVYVFNLEGGISPFVRSLKELRAFNFSRGNTSQLLRLLNDKTFPLTIESGERIALHESDMVIERKLKTAEDVKDNAPDHLARLFTYNNIMRQVGVNFFKDDFVNDALVEEATTAYIVSPVSSLIVLETQEDYDRFGIRDKDNSLHNATKNSSGAVPEPHEWALIVVFLIFVAFQVVRHSRGKFLLVRK